MIDVKELRYQMLEYEVYYISKSISLIMVGLKNIESFSLIKYFIIHQYCNNTLVKSIHYNKVLIYYYNYINKTQSNTLRNKL